MNTCNVLQSIKVRYEKARREYDAGVNKVTVLRTKTKCEIVKLYAVSGRLAFFFFSLHKTKHFGCGT